MRHRVSLSLSLSLTIAFASLAGAQDLKVRSQSGVAPSTERGKYFRLGQFNPPLGRTGIDAPAPTVATTDPDNAGQTVPLPSPSGRRPISVNVDTRLGFDKTTLFVAGPTPFAATVRRRIRTMVISGAYPLSQRTRVSLNVPVVSQYTSVRGNGGGFSQRGSGLGDMSIWIDHAIPKPNKKLELGVAGGLILPTGRDPFGLRPDQLPTGLGFYQPAVRLSARTLSVPVQFYGSLDYSSSFKTKTDGERRKLPASYGAEAGFFYTLGPGWATQTSVSIGKSSSPVLQDSGSTVGYLTQALNYRTGGRISFRASLDVGLTDDSTDAYFGLSLNSTF